MASPGNRHCANYIDTLSFPIGTCWPSASSTQTYTSMLTALIQTKRLTNASAHRSAYPPLLALEQEIVGIIA